MIKNASYKGVSLFLVELRKHLQNGTIGESLFWRETTGRTALPIHYTFKDIKHQTLWDLVNWFIANYEDVSDAEFNKLLMEFPSQFWILDRKGWFMLEIKDESFVAKVAPIEVKVATETPVEAVVEIESPVVVEVQDSNEDVSEVVVQPAVADYDSMSDDQLRELAKDAKIKGAHNAKRETLITKLKS